MKPASPATWWLVAPPYSAVTWTCVRRAACSGRLTTRAATVIVPSVRRCVGRAGWRRGSAASCRCTISTSYSRCRATCTSWHGATGPSSDLLLKSAAGALLTLGRDPKWFGRPIQLGVTTVLHSWARDLHFHPHAHC